jgi:hypothetical protein
MGARAARGDDAAMFKFFLKVRAWWLRDELDERLAHGADPFTDPLLARRATQLLAPSTREDFADTLERALREARSKWSLTARLPLRRHALLGCSDDVLALAHRLRDGHPIDVAGAAQFSRLIFDGAGPLYRDGTITLQYAVRAARLALDPIELDVSEVWAA